MNEFPTNAPAGQAKFVPGTVPMALDSANKAQPISAANPLVVAVSGGVVPSGSSSVNNLYYQAKVSFVIGGVSVAANDTLLEQITNNADNTQTTIWFDQSQNNIVIPGTPNSANLVFLPQTPLTQQQLIAAGLATDATAHQILTAIQAQGGVTVVIDNNNALWWQVFNNQTTPPIVTSYQYGVTPLVPGTPPPPVKPYEYSMGSMIVTQSVLPDNAAKETGGNLSAIAASASAIAASAATIAANTSTANTTLSQISTGISALITATNAVTTAATGTTAAVNAASTAIQAAINTGNASAANIATNTAAIANTSQSILTAIGVVQNLQNTGITALGTLHTDSANTQALITTGNTTLAAIKTAIQALQSSAATSANQATEISSLASIVTALGAANTALASLVTASTTTNNGLSTIASKIDALGVTLGGGATLAQILTELGVIDTNVANFQTAVLAIENQELTQLTTIATQTTGINTATGTQADTAYSGTGSASIISALKGIYAALVGAFTVQIRKLTAANDIVTVVQPTGSALNATVSGTVAVSNFPGTQTVSGTVALGAGAANVGSITNVTGTVSLPTGASTAALQTTGNTTLTAIQTALGTPLQTGGTVVANAGTNLNTSALALETGGNLAGVNAKLGNVSGPVAPGAASNNSVLTGAVFNASAPTLATGQQAALQSDSSGNLKVSQPNTPLTSGSINALNGSVTFTNISSGTFTVSG